MNVYNDQHHQVTKAKLSKRERNLLAESVRVEEELLPGFVRPTLIVITLMVGSFLAWAGHTQLTEVSIASGNITPSGDIKVVQHFDGGIVDEIFVKPNGTIKQGQAIAKIRGDKTEAELLQIQARLAALSLQTERLKALTEDRLPNFNSAINTHPSLVIDQQNIYEYQVATRDSKLDILSRQIEQNEKRLSQLRNNLSAARSQQELTSELLVLRESLAKRKLIDRATLIETRRADLTAKEQIATTSDEIQVVNRELAEAESRYTETINQLQQDALSELGAIQAERAEVVELLKNLAAQKERLIVRASTSGKVHDLKIHTIGQVIQPGELLMEIVPDNSSLEAEVHIDPKDIGHVQVGQKVNVRVSSYDYTRFGVAKGILTDISPSNLLDAEGNPYFVGKVSFENAYVGDESTAYPLQIGMTVDADILTGEKTLLSYLLKPVTQAISKAFQER